MLAKEVLTIDEFNEKYRIHVESKVYQIATLTANTENLDYSGADEVLEGLNYIIIDKESEKAILTLYVENLYVECEHQFLDELKKYFDITDL